MMKYTAILVLLLATIALASTQVTEQNKRAPAVTIRIDKCVVGAVTQIVGPVLALVVNLAQLVLSLGGLVGLLLNGVLAGLLKTVVTSVVALPFIGSLLLPAAQVTTFVNALVASLVTSLTDLGVAVLFALPTLTDAIAEEACINAAIAIGANIA